MMDALEELSDLSLALQKSDVTLPAAVKLITKQISYFLLVNKTQTVNIYYTEACSAAESKEFRGVTLSSAKHRLPEIPKPQFYQALADSIVFQNVSPS